MIIQASTVLRDRQSEKKAVTNFSQNDGSSSASVNSLEPAPAFRAEGFNGFGIDSSKGNIGAFLNQTCVS